MPNGESTPLSDNEIQQLKYEAFVDEVLKIVSSKESPSSSKKGWEKFLESSGGTALITVLIGGIMGGLITGIFQTYSAKRERDVILYQQFIDKRLETIRNAYDLVGVSFATADSLIIFKTSPGTDASQQPPNIQKQLDEQKKSLLRNFDESRQKWFSERKKIILLLSYYYNDDKSVKEAWTKVDNSLTEYFEYSKNCFHFNSCEDSEKFKNALEQNIETLGDAVGKASKTSQAS